MRLNSLKTVLKFHCSRVNHVIYFLYPWVEFSFMFSVDSSEPNKPLEAVKSAIHDLFRTLDRSSRIQLVKWMNNVELEAGG